VTTFIFKNFGQTPAREMTIVWGTGISAQDVETIEALVVSKKTCAAVLWPNVPTYIPIPGLVAGQFVFGVIRYTDVFNEKRITTFQCFVESVSAIRPHEIGNTAT
jgi:hypothetical protein